MDVPQALSVRELLESSGTPFTIARYLSRAYLFVQGDPCQSVMQIQTGRVWLAVTTPDGREAICGVLAAGAFLGEDALTGRAVRRQTATAMTATEVLVVATADFTRLLHTYEAIAERFIAHTLARNARLEAELAEQLLYPAERRLAHTLLELAGCDERHPCRCVLPDVSQEILAEMVGTTRSHVNAFIGKFRRRGFVEKAGGVLRVNPARMQAASARLPAD